MSADLAAVLAIALVSTGVIELVMLVRHWNSRRRPVEVDLSSVHARLDELTAAVTAASFASPSRQGTSFRASG